MLLSLQMVIRSPFLLGLSSQNLATRFQALQTAFPDANVQRMVEYYPSLLEVNAACRTTTTAALRGTRHCVDALSYASSACCQTGVWMLI